MVGQTAMRYAAVRQNRILAAATLLCSSTVVNFGLFPFNCPTFFFKYHFCPSKKQNGLIKSKMKA